MRILVTGGAGYIGSHAVRLFTSAGHDVLAYDNLSRGRRVAVGDADLIVADLTDADALEDAFRRWNFDAVVHFAALISPEASMRQPVEYYRVNTCGTLSLLQCCLRHGVEQFIFSSTAAVYGEADVDSFAEDMPLEPINVYGDSKLMSERMLADVARASEALRYVSFRYYNVAGADAAGDLGTLPGTEHLIPRAVQAALSGGQLTIYGTDYDTPDGTCIRDYIHVTDLADLHLVALNYLAAGGHSETMNCGYGHGYSVREVISRVREVTAMPLDAQEGARREGDPKCLVADNTRVREVLQWQPQHDDLDDIIATDLRWRRSDGCRQAREVMRERAT